jgi:hypothetical protein
MLKPPPISPIPHPQRPKLQETKIKKKEISQRGIGWRQGRGGRVLELLLFKIEGERKGMAPQLLPSPPPLIFRSRDSSFARFEAYVFPLLPSS